MPKVAVSAVRLASMLANRGMAPTHLISALGEQHEPQVTELLDRDCDIEFETLVLLAGVFHRPWPYLLVDGPEQPARRRRDHRTLRNEQHRLGAEILDQVTAAESMLLAAAALFPSDTYQVPRETISVDTDVELAARVLRDFLSVDPERQLSARDAFSSLRLWSAAIQDRGVYVSMRRLEDPTVRAFSITEGGFAVVVADTQDTPYARVFSLLHEYVHVILNDSGLCDLDEHSEIERFCNSVAAAVLMPHELIARCSPHRNWGETTSGDDVAVQTAAAMLGVSQASLLIRLLELGHLDREVYEALDARRAQRKGLERGRGGDYYRNALNRVGRRWSRSVMSAWNSGAIDRQEAGILLEIPEHNVPRFRRELERTGP